MDSAKSQNGWKISDVERLVGLRRRDIQRACYQGRGGVGILSPAESSWGRRLYSQEDLFKLFLVKWERDRGLSLPEIKSLFDEEEAKEGGWDQFTQDQVSLMREEFEEAAWRLVCTEALRAATVDGEDALDDCIERILLIGAFELLDGGRMWSGEEGSGSALESGTEAEAAATPLVCCLKCLTRLSEADLGSLWSELAVCRRQGLAPDAAETQGVVARALAFDGFPFQGAEEADAEDEAVVAEAEGVQAADGRSCGEVSSSKDAGRSDEAGFAGMSVPGVSAPAGFVVGDVLDGRPCASATAWAEEAEAAEAAEACKVLCLLLDTPGMELALELKLGPGAFEYVRDSIEAFAAAAECDGEDASGASGEKREGELS